jgi:hypothetical protein
MLMSPRQLLLAALLPGLVPRLLHSCMINLNSFKCYANAWQAAKHIYYRSGPCISDMKAFR